MSETLEPDYDARNFNVERVTPPRETLHEETERLMTRTAEKHREVAAMYADVAEEGYAPNLLAEAEKYAYAAQCVRDVQALQKQYADAVNSGVEIATDLAALRAENTRLKADRDAYDEAQRNAYELADHLAAQVKSLATSAAIVEAMERRRVQVSYFGADNEGSLERAWRVVSLAKRGPTGWGDTLLAAYERATQGGA